MRSGRLLHQRQLREHVPELERYARHGFRDSKPYQLVFGGNIADDPHRLVDPQSVGLDAYAGNDLGRIQYVEIEMYDRFRT